MSLPARRVWLAGALAVVIAGALAVASAAEPRVGSAVGQVSEQVGKGKPRPVAGAVVYLSDAPSLARKSTRRRQAIQQKDLKFLPAFMVVMKGDWVDFPNNERHDVDHNVFSPRDVGTTWFNLGRYGRGESQPYRFSRPGVYHIYCDIHPAMKAQVKVVENEFYAYTRADGSFSIPAVPAGTYEIRVWRPDSPEESGTVTVAAGARSAPVQLVFKSAAQSGSTRHRRLDGSRYPEY